MTETHEARWLLLIHQIPPKPSYFRVKVWRRLGRLGAVAIKNSVYALPRSDSAQEGLQRVVREILEGGGDASLVEARFVDGLSDEHVEALFHAARDADYAAITDGARELLARLGARGGRTGDEVAAIEAELVGLRRRLGEVMAIDFFGAPGQADAESTVAQLEERLASGRPAARAAAVETRAIRGGTWVARKGIHVDRMASAWLIRRFIDPEARFKFVAHKGYHAEAGELRFDRYEAEHTHEADRCSFEVLVERFDLRDPALRPIAELVHDVDLKDGKHGRAETAGFEHVVAGIALAHRDDEARLARASAVLDDLYEYFRRVR